MTTYFFNTEQAGIVSERSEVDLPNLQAAKEMATEYAGDLIKERDGSIFDRDIVVEVLNSEGLMLLRVVVMGVISPAAQLGVPSDRALRSTAS